MKHTRNSRTNEGERYRWLRKGKSSEEQRKKGNSDPVSVVRRRKQAKISKRALQKGATICSQVHEGKNLKEKEKRWPMSKPRVGEEVRIACYCKLGSFAWFSIST